MAVKVEVGARTDEVRTAEAEGARRRGRKSTSRLDQKLKKGYWAMVREDRRTSERNLKAGWEVFGDPSPLSKGRV